MDVLLLDFQHDSVSAGLILNVKAHPHTLIEMRYCVVRL